MYVPPLEKSEKSGARYACPVGHSVDLNLTKAWTRASGRFACGSCKCAYKLEDLRENVVEHEITNEIAKLAFKYANFAAIESVDRANFAAPLEFYIQNKTKYPKIGQKALRIFKLKLEETLLTIEQNILDSLFEVK